LGSKENEDMEPGRSKAIVQITILKRMALQLYYITDRRQFAGDGHEQEQRLLAKITECAAAGIQYVQLREKDLAPRALEELAMKAMTAIAGSRTQLLINSRTDVALACGAHGVHLPANDLAASEVRSIFARVSKSEHVIGVSTHSAAEVASAEAHGASFAVFGPVFEKSGSVNRDGLKQLRRICHRTEAAQPPMPVWALGGIMMENAQQCAAAGAAGIAAIRLFQQNEVANIVKKLRALQL
jgi:thiamine-phosphate pyrophosphorylase